MTERVYLSQVKRDYIIHPRHNINHFIPSSLYIEKEGKYIFLKGKHFKKSYTKIATLTPKKNLPPIFNLL